MSINDKNIFYRGSISTEKRQATVMAIHGLGDSSSTFLEMVAEKTFKGLSFFTPDMVGYGKTPKDVIEQTKTLSEHASILYEWLNRFALYGLNNRDVILLGHSMGGVIGMMICELFPNTVRAFINVEGNVTKEDCGLSKIIASYPRDDFISHQYMDFQKTIRKKVIESIEQQSFSLARYYKSLLNSDPATLWDNSSELLSLSEENVITERLSKIRQRGTKIYFIAGEADKGGLSEQSKVELEKKNIKVNTISGSGHWPFLDQPEKFYALIRHTIAEFSPVFD